MTFIYRLLYNLASLIVFILYLCIFVIVGIGFLLGTESGSQWLIKTLLSSQDRVQVEKTEGILLKKLTLYNIKTEQADIDSLELTWQGADIINKKIYIKNLNISEVYLKPTKNNEKNNTEIQPFELPDIKLPITIQADTISINKIYNNDITIKNVQAHANFKNNKLELKAQVKHIDILSQEYTASDIAFYISGNTENYQVLTTTTMIGKNIPRTILRLAIQGDKQGILSKNFNINILKGNIAAQLDAKWYPFFQWNIQLTAQDIHLQQYLDKTIVNTDVFIKGHYKDKNIETRLDIQKLNGLLYDYPFDITSQLLVKNDYYQLDSLNIKVKDNTIQAKGNYSKDIIKLEYNINAKNLKYFLADLQGKIDLQGQIKLDLNNIYQANINTKGTIKNFVYQNYKIKNADITVNMDKEISVNTIFDNIIINQEKIDYLMIKTQGAVNNHKIFIKTRAKQMALELGLEGGYQEKKQQWQGLLKQLSFNGFQHSLVLQQPTALSLSPKKITIDYFCLQEKQARLCQNFSFDQTITTRGNWQNINLQDIPQDIAKITGNIAIDWDIYQQNQDFFGKVNIMTSQGEVEVNDFKQVFLPIYIQNNLSKDIVETSINLAVPEYGKLGADIKLGNLFAKNWQDYTIQANIKAPNIILESLLPSAHASLLVKAQGSLQNPSIDAHIKAFVKQYTVEELGITFKNINLTAESSDKENIALQGSITSSEEQLLITGNINIKKQTVNLNVKAKDFNIMDSAEIKAYISPDLNIYYDKKLDITGNLIIPKLDVVIKKLPPSAINPSSDVVFVDNKEEKKTSKSLPFPVTANIQLKLGKKVFINALDFKIHLAGNLSINQNEKTVAQGELEIVKGTYRAYKQDLLIENGKLYFAGPVDNPRLNIQAVRADLTDKTVGVLVKGTAKKPQITLFSDPQLEEIEILSYLVLGYSFRKAQQSDGTTLVAAIAQLGLKAGNSLSKKIGDSLGIDSISLVSNQTTPLAGIALGKYLTPRLYIEYTMGLLGNENIIKMQYELTGRWKLQVEQGSSYTAGDVIYSIEY